MSSSAITFFSVAQRGIEAFIVTGGCAKYPVHTHISTYIVCLVTSGAITIAKRGTLEHVGSGQAFVMPPDMPHTLKSKGCYSILTLCFHRSLLENGKRSSFAAMASRLLRRLTAEKYIGMRGKTVLAAALRELYAIGENARQTPRPGDRLESLKNHLANHPATRLELSDMAELAHIDKFHLIRKFRKRYGITPVTFRTQSRIRAARRGIAAGIPLARTALDAGFYDQSHFSREFRRLTGMTPREYGNAKKACRPMRQA